MRPVETLADVFLKIDALEDTALRIRADRDAAMRLLEQWVIGYGGLDALSRQTRALIERVKK